MIDQLLSEIESLRLQLMEDTLFDRNLQGLKRIHEAIQAGRSVAAIERVTAPSMKERYLAALLHYDSQGLTPQELFKKRLAWLLHPADVARKDNKVKAPDKIGTVAMFLLRLHHQGLAGRQKEGHTYRYFLNKSGQTRLMWYMNPSNKGRPVMDKWLDAKFWENYSIIKEMKNKCESIVALYSSTNSKPRLEFLLIWHKITELLDAVALVQLSLSSFISEETVKSAVQALTSSLDNLRSMQKTLFNLSS